MNIKSNQGFTLIEILIVLFIIGILAFSVMLHGGAQQTQNAKAVTDRLKSVMRYAEQQAILQSATLGFKYDAQGYYFLRYETFPAQNQGSWQPLTQERVLRYYAFPSQISLTMHDKPNISPAIIFLPTGEITPFQINILFNNKKSRYQITGDRNGNIRTASLR